MEVDGDWGTPTTVVLAGKETVDFISGATSVEELEQLYDEMACAIKCAADKMPGVKTVLIKSVDVAKLILSFI